MTEHNVPTHPIFGRLTWESIPLHEPILVPADCEDGFGGCYWNRPEAYLDQVVQDGMSFFAQLDPEVRRRGTEQLRADLADGTWDERHGELREQVEIDIGYRLLVAGHLS